MVKNAIFVINAANVAMRRRMPPPLILMILSLMKISETICFIFSDLKYKPSFLTIQKMTNNDKLYQTFMESKSIASTKTSFAPALTGSLFGAGIFWHSNNNPKSYPKYFHSGSRIPLITGLFGISYGISAYMLYKESEAAMKLHFGQSGFDWPLSDQQRRVIMEMDLERRKNDFQEVEEFKSNGSTVLDAKNDDSWKKAYAQENVADIPVLGTNFNKNEVPAGPELKEYDPYYTPASPNGEKLSLDVKPGVVYKTWDDTSK